MTDSKTPDWAKEEAEKAMLDSPICMIPTADWDAAVLLISQALLSAYERGRKEGIEEAAKVVDDNMLCSSRSGDEVLLARGSSGNRVGSAYATAIRQLLEVKG